MILSGKEIVNKQGDDIIIKPFKVVPSKDELFFDLKFYLGCIVFKIYLNSEIKTNL